MRGGKSGKAKEGGSRISPETGAGSSQVEPSKYLRQFQFGIDILCELLKKLN